MTTVKVHGREMTFSEEELKDILESHFTTSPTEGRWFEVNPLSIDQEIFAFERKDKKQERTRQYILDAFVEMLNNPKYKKTFYTYIPVKDWEEKSYEELRTLASCNGGKIATWVHQALEWAQRIANGESWESICNEPDKSKWYRLVRGKGRDDIWTVGGCIHPEEFEFPATDILIREELLEHKEFLNNFKYEVPLIVKYK